MSIDTTSEIATEIASANGRFMAAFRQGDVAAIASLYTTAGQLLPPHSDVVAGADGIRTFWQGALNLGLKEAVLETVDIDVSGETAIEVGRYQLRGEGGAMADNGKYLVVWKKERGTWKLHRDMWNTSQPPAA